VTDAAATTASVLLDALPYIRRFSGSVIVVKYGGAAIETERTAAPSSAPGASLATFASDVVLLRTVGMLPVVVHGGGPEIGRWMQRLDKTPEFRDGLRVTDAETLEIARMVLVGNLNRTVVGAINRHGPLAVGLSGEDAGLITATQRHPDLGFVGDVTAVDPSLLRRLVAEGLVPVVATIGSSLDGQAYNINADSVAGAVAESLEATKLIFLTDVNGIRRDASDPGSLASVIRADELDELASNGALTGGMLPKAAACAHAVRHGVGEAHVLDGRVEHALLLELLTSAGLGSMVVDR
jgi:acetylglutamate kinase